MHSKRNRKYIMNSLKKFNMTQKDKRALKRNIKQLLKYSYEDDGNSYELEFRDMLEQIVDVWDELITSRKGRTSRLAPPAC